MGEQNKEQKIVQLFIKIILYLLLAFAFFSDYYIAQGIGTGAITIFLSAIVSLIALSIIYSINFENKIYLAWVSILPFGLILSFNLTLLYYKALNINYEGWEFFTVGIPRLLPELIHAKSIISIYFIMCLFLIIYLIILLWKKCLFRRVKLKHLLNTNNP